MKGCEEMVQRFASVS